MSDIHTKLATIAGKIGPVNKTEKNREQGFNFRSIEQITAAARPLFAAEGVSVAPRLIFAEHSEVTSKSGTKGFRTIVHMGYTFTAGSDDSSVDVSMPGEAVDYGDKSTSKAVQMAYKYALTQVLQVGSGDPDPDTHTVEEIAESRPRQRRPQATPSHKTVPVTDDNMEGAKWANRQKLLLLEALGDKESAKQAWAEVLEKLSLTPDDEIPEDAHGSIEAELDLLLAEAVIEEQLPL